MCRAGFIADLLTGAGVVVDIGTTSGICFCAGLVSSVLGTCVEVVRSRR